SVRRPWILASSGRRCGASPRAQGWHHARFGTSPGDTEPRSGRSPAAADVPERAITRGEVAAAPAARAVAATARRAHEHTIAALEHVLLAIVDAPAVDAAVAQPARCAAGEAGRGKFRALGHNAQHDRTRRPALHQDVLAEAASKTARTARARAKTLVVEEERALALGDLDR